MLLRGYPFQVRAKGNQKENHPFCWRHIRTLGDQGCVCFRDSLLSSCFQGKPKEYPISDPIPIHASTPSSNFSINHTLLHNNCCICVVLRVPFLRWETTRKSNRYHGGGSPVLTHALLKLVSTLYLNDVPWQRKLRDVVLVEVGRGATIQVLAVKWGFSTKPQQAKM